MDTPIRAHSTVVIHCDRDEWPAESCEAAAVRKVVLYWHVRVVQQGRH
jgi:hypothetical protein